MKEDRKGGICGLDDDTEYVYKHTLLVLLVVRCYSIRAESTVYVTTKNRQVLYKVPPTLKARRVRYRVTNYPRYSLQGTGVPARATQFNQTENLEIRETDKPAKPNRAISG